MSSWLVSDIHLSAIVQQALVSKVIAPPVADNLWKMMKHDNLFALECRYGDECPDEWTDVELNRTAVEAELDTDKIIHLISCWNYQCAEFDGWDNTYAYRIGYELERTLLREKGYELRSQWRQDMDSQHKELPWGIDMWRQVTIPYPDPEPEAYDFWNPIEQGMYDDDPNPYHGDYSEI